MYRMLDCVSILVAQRFEVRARGVDLTRSRRSIGVSPSFLFLSFDNTDARSSLAMSMGNST